MRGVLIAAIVCPLFGSGTAFAQVGMGAGTTPRIGLTSPLGIGPGARVGGTGIPLGAMELATPGVSPTAASPSAPGAMTSGTACSSSGGSMTAPSGAMAGTSSAGAMSGTSAPTPLFDGAGAGGSASGTCATTAAASSSPTASPSIGSRSTIGRVGFPMGSTELATGGLSPLPNITMSPPSVISTGTTTAPCPTTGMPSTTAGC